MNQALSLELPIYYRALFIHSSCVSGFGYCFSHVKPRRLIEELKRREAALLQRQRMIAALDLALHVLRTKSPEEAVDITDSLAVTSLFNIGDHIVFDTEQRCLIFDLHDSAHIGR